MRTLCLDENPYQDLIVKYFNQEFPQISKMNHNDKVDIICDIMIGTKEVRYGSLPNPESLVTIRKTIREAVLGDFPIPVLVPWGSMKGDYSGNVDIAEVSAINRLIHLNKTVMQIHPKGLDISMRIEDTSGYVLLSYDQNIELVKNASKQYCDNLIRLITVLDKDKCITPRLESSMEFSEMFDANVKRYVSMFEEYLFESHNSNEKAELPSYKRLQEKGWIGIIPNEQRQHYYDSYTRLYKDKDISISIKRLALYFCQSFVRYKLGMTGNKKEWSSYVTASFVPPIKGLPDDFHSNRLYYRTLPMSQARTHMCPWRAKGYLQINGNQVCAKLTTFNNDEINSQLFDSIVTLEDNLICNIKTSYHLIN
jgi:hypothetical protein